MRLKPEHLTPEMLFPQERIDHWKSLKYWTFNQLYWLLKPYEPSQLSSKDAKLRREITQEKERWVSLCKKCPDFPKDSSFPMEVPLPADKLLAWAESLDGLTVPEIWHSLYKTPPEASLAPRERHNLLSTIGILALALADAAKLRSGKNSTPNISKLVAHCAAVVDLPPGLQESTLRNRVSAGMAALREKVDC